MTSHDLSLVPAAASRPPAEPSVFSRDLPVIANEPVNEQYLRLALRAPSQVLDACRPGQFFQLLCPQTGIDRPFLRRPMSIYGIDRERGELHFLYKVTGAGTRGLFHLGPGDTLGVVGPLGLGFEVRPQWSRLLLAARGVGLATLAPLAQEARRLGRHLTAICSARRPDLLMSVDLFRDLGAEVVTITDSEGTSGVDTLSHIVEERIVGDGVDALFTCGSSRMLAALRALSVRHGIPGQVALEQQMACGLGMCHCCVRPFVRDGETVQLRVCREGPVFDMAETSAW